MDFSHIEARAGKIGPPARLAMPPASATPDMERATAAVATLLDALGVPLTQHTRDTPARVAKMLASEIFAGLYQGAPEATSFEAPSLDQVYAVGPAVIRSCCAHHLVPIIGQAWFAVRPGSRLIGLSKFGRLASWVMARPQVQEEATEHLADAVTDACQPEGLIVVVRARHFCCAWRGIRDDAQMMATSVVRGSFRSNPAQRQEAFSLLAGLGLPGAAA